MDEIKQPQASAQRPRPEHLVRNFRHPSKEALDVVENSIRKNYHGNLVNELNYDAEAYALFVKADLRAHLIGRLQVDRYKIIPWLDAARSLTGLRILEVGCGTGSSTVALAEQGADVVGVDIDERVLVVARDRCNAYGVSAELLQRNADSILQTFGVGRFDMIIFFASLEHMTIEERLVALRDAWAMLPQGGLLTIIETPNRLWFDDSHTSDLPFFNWLPDELAFRYSRMSPAPRFRTLYETYDENSKLSFLRDGRGMSYHEIDLAIGPAEDLQVVSCCRSFDPAKVFVSDVGRAYQAILKRIRPNLHEGFFEEYLDLIIRKP